ncbi:MAG: hypothetical protein U0350_46095 [Caldilineaceae bacterium]
MKTAHFFLAAQRQGDHTSSHAWQRTTMLLIVLVLFACLALLAMALFTHDGYGAMAGGKSLSIAMGI